MLDDPFPSDLPKILTLWWTEPETQTRWKQQVTIDKVEHERTLTVFEYLTPQGLEQRQAVRYSLSLPLTIRTGPWPWQFIKTHTIDVSLTGLRCLLPVSWPPKQEHPATISLDRQVIHMDLHLLRTDFDSQGHYQTACQIIFASTHDHNQWKQFLLSIPRVGRGQMRITH
ncbi:PilZ domain-containing protein [Sulfobacillus thermosulfidooxidans DSM 9293]|uniref:PilZ domain-containing protein n=1 Tax=Sulfobacillus thermosulfidooxidans (strain DSM 9293 / VKM B-1269 / AT-1) TaxID=929705 RepID=A0A1W1WHH6_SULTA|nr:PilZ domain-containing protein [Sulfobacillus thermosulfidooxidans]SMC05758.1 PilZ domain-containing protein [Sulfobacillus thermosulfidooxidans DSM 9293]